MSGRIYGTTNSYQGGRNRGERVYGTDGEGEGHERGTKRIFYFYYVLIRFFFLVTLNELKA